MSGLHILGRACIAGGFEPKVPGYYLEQIIKIVCDAGLKSVGLPGLHVFEGGGFTLFVMLQESHISLHTWFELGFVDLDVFTCGVTRDNSEATRQVFTAVAGLFEPIRIDRRHEIVR